MEKQVPLDLAGARGDIIIPGTELMVLGELCAVTPPGPGH